MHRLERRYVLAFLSNMKSQLEAVERLILAGGQDEEPKAEPVVEKRGHATPDADARAEADVGRLFEELTEGVKIAQAADDIARTPK